MKTILIVAGALIVGLAIGVLLGEATIRHLRKRLKELRAIQKQELRPRNWLRSVTNFLFVTTQVFALGWVSISYGISIYSTVVLMQPFPAVELSQQAISTILGVSIMKVVENIFEHNEGFVFGQSKKEQSEPQPPTEEEASDSTDEGMG